MKRYRSGHWLERKYWDEGLTQKEIAEECGISATTVREYSGSVSRRERCAARIIRCPVGNALKR
ncbi:LuxR C-terminal-related transcriptional regulator [Halorussus amylolyticus]|uniref:LuxR C-terminal-related transcriptional regulator n=1 Tax=Halorussus amylolyticus TaxID=1126242 RepID=UPI0010448CF3